MKLIKKESWRSGKDVNIQNNMYRITVDMTIKEYYEIFKKILKKCKSKISSPSCALLKSAPTRPYRFHLATIGKSDIPRAIRTSQNAARAKFDGHYM